MLRQDDENPCPFGLPISQGCRCAGNLVERMGSIESPMPNVPLDKDKVRNLVEVNNMMLRWYTDCSVCKYAGMLFDENDAIVECNADSTAAGIHEGPVLAGSPMFYKMYAGVGIDGLYSYPLGYYRDGAIDRGMYYGRYNFPDGINTGRFTLENPGSSISSAEADNIRKTGNK